MRSIIISFKNIFIFSVLIFSSIIAQHVPSNERGDPAA